MPEPSAAGCLPGFDGTRAGAAMELGACVSEASCSGLLLLGLHDESLVDMGDNTTTGNGGLDQGVELLISADRQLQVARSDTFDLEVFACVACKFEHLSGQVLKNSGGVHSRSGTDTAVAADTSLEEPVDAADGELHKTHDKVINEGSFLSEI